MLAALLAFVVPAFAAGESDLCGQLSKFVDDDHAGFRQVRLVWRSQRPAPECTATDAAERRLCRWLVAHHATEYPVVLSQEALACLGHDPLPPDDPDVFVTNAWWTRGGFEAESGPLHRDGLSFAMDMDLDGDHGAQWMLFTARRK